MLRLLNAPVVLHKNLMQSETESLAGVSVIIPQPVCQIQGCIMYVTTDKVASFISVMFEIYLKTHIILILI